MYFTDHYFQISLSNLGFPTMDTLTQPHWQVLLCRIFLKFYSYHVIRKQTAAFLVFPIFLKTKEAGIQVIFFIFCWFFVLGIELPGQTRWCYGVIMRLLIYLHKVNFMVEIQNVWSYDKSMDSLIDILVTVMIFGSFVFFQNVNTTSH